MSEKNPFAGLPAMLIDASLYGHDLDFYIRESWSMGRVAVIYIPYTRQYWIAKEAPRRFLWWRWMAIELEAHRE